MCFLKVRRSVIVRGDCGGGIECVHEVQYYDLHHKCTIDFYSFSTPTVQGWPLVTLDE